MGGGMGGIPPEMLFGRGGMPGMSGMGGMPGMMGGMPGMGGGRPQRRERERPDVIPGGTAVTVRGLVGAAQHNGKRGKVAQFDDDAGRYVVQLEDGEALRIKPENVML